MAACGVEKWGAPADEQTGSTGTVWVPPAPVSVHGGNVDVGAVGEDAELEPVLAVFGGCEIAEVES